MCGICGIISRAPLTPDDLAELDRLNDLMRHRGPDATGTFQSAHTALAMRRLSIIDLAGGQQPLYNEDRSLALVANGEIYNFIELRAALQEKGHRFQTGSDCETILHVYEDAGTDGVQALRGMFAFALWDTRRRRLMLARDRMGEKPLYLYEQDDYLLFASELKALLKSKLVPFELDPAAIHLYFQYQYVPEPATPIRDVRKLNAGHWLTVGLDSWQVQETCYWHMEDAPPLEDDPPTRIRQELETLSTQIIRSDVPVGIALSGGLDSSAIAVLAAKHYPGTLQAFSVGYPGRPEYDERAQAKKLADHLKLPLHEIELEPGAVTAFFPELVHARDDPIADIAGHGYYAVMKLAREKGVPVVLQGQGGDELFWGYPWVTRAVRESRLKALLQREGALALPAYLRPTTPDGWAPWQIRQWLADGCGVRSGWTRFQRHRAQPLPPYVFYDLAADYQAAQTGLTGLYPQSFIEQLAESAPRADPMRAAPPDVSPAVFITRLICDSYLRSNGIAQGDRLSMASAIELRLPLVDYKLVETVIGLRKVRPDDRRPPKAWFKKAVADIVPPWVLSRPKRGFAPPVRDWHAALFAAHGRQLDGGYLVGQQILSPEAGSRLAGGEFPAGLSTPLSFKALVLETWCRRMS